MSTPSAEVLISPEIAMNALKEMQKDFDKTFKNISKKFEKELEDSIEDGIEKGGKAGARGLGRILRRVGGGIGGIAREKGGSAIGVASRSLVGLAMAGLFSSIEQAQQGSEIITSMLGESTVTGDIATARAAGMNLNQYGQFVRTLEKQGGFTDRQSINDILTDFSEAVFDSAQAGDDGYLRQFSQYKGQDRIYRVLSSLAPLKESEQVGALAQLGWSGEDAQRLLAVIGSMSGGGKLSASETYKNFSDANKTSGEKLADQMREENKLAQEFRQKQLQFQDDYRQRFLNHMSEAKINALFTSRNDETQKMTQLISDYQENLETARTAQTALNESMAAMAATTNLILDGVKSIVAAGQDLPEKLREIGDDVQTAINEVKDALPNW
ncbi:TPA: hypothetical protein P0E12_004992 [Vibrio harveyi]|nr:hypothetical protein [Vibrio harveyi]